jgi:hypothetical protein
MLNLEKPMIGMTFQVVALVLASVITASAQHKGMCDLVSKEKISEIMGATVTMVSDSPPGGDIKATGVSRQCQWLVFDKGVLDPKHGALVVIMPTYPNMTPEIFKTMYAPVAKEIGFIDILGSPAFFSRTMNNAALELRVLVPGSKEEMVVGIGNKEKFDNGYKAYKDPVLRDGVLEIATMFVKNLLEQPKPK